ncbi:SdpA family antimicrobial peptide system protein [Ornithinibacillus sp. L9]|uniref:SdpA family antimicrobial peptide system protein n=1 Tax=Ornithinibacillus caprae TaxID=2678566 RepID=A0A6N8FLM0_9BACI|nr:SdpA family antimicrobial peptide system protein [Ornithinibacillus caprae]MUK90365.1 SdpA family antimicrobial peptide system protein [Ornithinibacillus caprae]
MKERKEKQKYLKYGIVFLLAVLFWSYIFIASIHRVLPHNPITSLPLAEELNIETWLPQGWGFFSKDPREPSFQIISVEDSEEVVYWPNNRVKNYFGLKRLGRSQGIEAGLISSKLSQDSLVDCEDDPRTCLENFKESIEVENPTPLPTLCGDLGIVYQEPVPWAWSKNSKEITMPSQVVRVNVECSET